MRNRELVNLEAYLASRASNPGRLKRIGNAGEMAFDYPASASSTLLEIDKGKMRISGICSSEAIDRSRERVLAAGMDVSAHQLNPIFTINHQWRYTDGIVGRCEVDGEYTVKPGAVEGNKTPFAAQFFQDGPNAYYAEQAFALVDSGVMRGVSIGFVFPPDGAEKVIAEDGAPILQISKCQLFEVTILPIGDNPDAVVTAVEKGFGGKPLHARLLNMLVPLMPAKRTIVRSGFDNTKVKTMSDLNAGSAPADTGNDSSSVTSGGDSPSVPPSAQCCSDLNTYAVGLLRFLDEQLGTQENPTVKEVIPELQLMASEMFRRVQEVYTELQADNPDLPALPGAGSLLVAKAEKPVDSDVEPEGEEKSFGDGYDADDEAVEEDDDKKKKEKSFGGAMRSRTRKILQRFDTEKQDVRTKAMQDRSHKVLDAFWSTWQREISASDAVVISSAVEVLAKAGRANLTESGRAKALSAAAKLREKVLTVQATTGNKPDAPAGTADDAATAKAIADQLAADFAAALKPVQDGLFKITGAAL